MNPFMTCSQLPYYSIPSPRHPVRLRSVPDPIPYGSTNTYNCGLEIPKMPHFVLQQVVKALKRLITLPHPINSRLWHFLKALNPSSFLQRIFSVAFAPNCKRNTSRPPEARFRNPPDTITFLEPDILASRLPNPPLLPLHSQDQMAGSAFIARPVITEEPEYDVVDRSETQSPQSMSMSRSPTMFSNSVAFASPSKKTSQDSDVSNQAQHGPCRPGLSEVVGDQLAAVTPEEYERYERNCKVKRHHWKKYILDPLETSYTRPDPPSGWSAYVHPDGGLYFSKLEVYSRPTDGPQEIPILTDMYIYDKAVLSTLDEYIKQIIEYITTYDIKLPSDTCLVLELRLSGRCGYYFVDHAQKCIYWLDEFDARGYLDEVRVKYKPSHIGHMMQAWYWLHKENFPETHHFDEEDLLRLKDILIHALGDSMTAPTHMAQYAPDVLQKMLDLVRCIEDPSSEVKNTSKRRPGSLAFIYRMLHNFHHGFFLHLHGEREARLGIDQSIHPDREKTLLIKILSPLCFYGPNVHLNKLLKISIDTLVRKNDWAALLEKLTEEWKDFTLYATVLLNANIAFLAIQSVDEAAPPHGRTIAQRASYVSIVASVGAVVLGLVLVRLHNTSIKRGFLIQRSVSMVGLEMLALMYSLPYTLLMWGMVLFLVAFSSLCFASQDTITTVMISLSWPILGLVLLWTISSSFEDTPFWFPWLFRHHSWCRKLPDSDVIIPEGRLRPHPERTDEIEF